MFRFQALRHAVLALALGMLVAAAAGAVYASEASDQDEPQLTDLVAQSDDLPAADEVAREAGNEPDSSDEPPPADFGQDSDAPPPADEPAADEPPADDPAAGESADGAAFEPRNEPAAESADEPATEPVATEQDATEQDAVERTEPAGIELTWETDYATATEQARQTGRMLLVHFYDDAKERASDGFLREVDTKPAIRKKLTRFVLARLPLDAAVTVKGEPVKLLDHAAFAEMEHKQGIVVIDYANRESEQYGYVVTSLPFHSGKYYRYDPRHVAVLLDLPPGTLTQRALVFAVRIHPEAPASTKGDLDPGLIKEAKQHSQYQAQIHVQGHHHWDHRFPRIHNLLTPFGLIPQEVVAESWPHENLLDAAVDCVHSWRQSPGHWGAVKRDQPKFAYDMRRGSNGIWYATGIFGNRH